jgi:mRNA interferase RelE/StbE
LAGAKVKYKASVAGDLDRLERTLAVRILGKIEKALAAEGRAGEPLAGEFAGLYRPRVGDHRVIYARTAGGYLVLRIGHRGDVYRKGRP